MGIAVTGGNALSRGYTVDFFSYLELDFRQCCWSDRDEE